MKSKLKKCKTCGAEIAKSANVCPNCGANLTFKKPAVIIGLIFWIVALIFFFKACGALGNSPSASSNNASKEVSAEITSTDLWNAYSDNEINADNQYKDKLIAVTGTITDIGKDSVSGNPCVSLNSGDQLGIYPIQCFFSKDDASNEQVSALKNGDSITIYGTCAGKYLVTVQLSGCYLSE